jgi:hypothetical protein
LRSDEPVVFAGMTWSQNISVALLVGGAALWISRRRPHGEGSQLSSNLAQVTGTHLR